MNQLRSEDRASKMKAFGELSRSSQEEADSFFNSLTAQEQRELKKEIDSLENTLNADTDISHTNSIIVPANYRLGDVFKQLQYEDNGVKVVYSVQKSGRSLFKKEKIIYSLSGPVDLVNSLIKRVNSSIKKYEETIR